MKKKTYPLYYGGQKQQFARSVVVGDLVFCSGMSGRTMETGDVSSDDVKEQMLVALDKVRAALEEAGSSMEHIVKTMIYLKDVKDYDVMRRDGVRVLAEVRARSHRRAAGEHLRDAGVAGAAEHAGGDRRRRLSQGLTRSRRHAGAAPEKERA